MIDYQLQIVGCAAVIEPKLMIHIIAASAEVPRNDIETIRRHGARHSCDICATGITLKAVRYNDKTLIAITQPVQVEEVIIVRGDALAIKRYIIDTA